MVGHLAGAVVGRVADRDAPSPPGLEIDVVEADRRLHVESTTFEQVQVLQGRRRTHDDVCATPLLVADVREAGDELNLDPAPQPAQLRLAILAPVVLRPKHFHRPGLRTPPKATLRAGPASAQGSA